MSAYYVCFQTENKYKNISYGSNSIYNSACGCASLINALWKLGIKNISLEDMCKFSVSVKARVVGGTDEAKLLKYASEKFGFTWKSTSKNAELWEHLKKGYPAIMWAGTLNKVFSNSGHFVCAYEAIGKDTVRVKDSYWYDDKYKSTLLRKKVTKEVEKGVVDVSLDICGKATIDRNPSYFLIYPKNITQNVAKDDDDMIYKNISDVPSWYRTAVQKCIDKGAITGDGKGLNIHESTCKTLTILDRLGKL